MDPNKTDDQSDTNQNSNSNPIEAPSSPVVTESTNTTPAEPVVPSVDDAPKTPVVGSVGGSGGSKKRWLMPAVVAAAAVVVLGGGYVFAFYLPNTPSNVYSTSFKKSGEAVDKLVDYTSKQTVMHYKGATFDGTLKVKSSTASFDASLNGAFDSNSNGKLELKADLAGQNVTANLRSIKASGNTSPDIYLQVSGVKSLLDAYGLGGLDNQWVSIDHTLIDTYASSLKDSTSLKADTGALSAGNTPTADQINDAISKVQAVNKQYLFTTDESKAVIVKQKFVAKETQNGRSVDHFKVGYNKDHLQAYVGALKTALDSSKLNDWAKKANGGKSISESMDIASLQNDIKNSKATYSFDLWVDAKTKLISNIEFTSQTDPSSKFNIGQNYTGGSIYPIVLGLNTKSGHGNVTFTVNTETNKVTFDLTAATTTGGSTSVTAHFNAAPSNQTVKVTAPTGAKPLTEVLGQLGLPGVGATPVSASGGLSPLSFTQ
ncbi:MAG: hypothetical protein WC498_00840 [Candidatus Saccharimonadales bacterium]